MDVYHKAPFRLIHELSKRLKDSLPTTNPVREYWNPTHNWEFWEYFGPSFNVLGRVDAVNSVEAYAFGLRYENDCDFSGNL